MNCSRLRILSRVVKNMSMSKRCKLDSSKPKSSPLKVDNDKSVSQMDTETEVTYLPPPTKAPTDKKEYSVIQLPNGLTALLISDKPYVSCEDVPSSEENEISDSESSSSDFSRSSSNQSLPDISSSASNTHEEKMAACALCIGVGSFSDPQDIPGLAHFLEHMVFMGSKKYPKENEFDSYIKKKGGSDNASTECEYTTFYFECHDQHLHKGMDMFSQFFISPLMKREAMTREREAIESEFQMTLPIDSVRKQELICRTAHPKNPVGKFMWGNLVTLRDNVSDTYLYKSVHKFRERHYSAHRMKLAVQARFPLKMLEEWVVECFSTVPNNHLDPEVYSIPIDELFLPEFYNMFIVEPIKDICEVEINWIMPSVLNLYKAKPTDYISWLVGHEGKGSLASFLRKHLWALDIAAGHGEDGVMYNSLYTMFSVTVQLTEEGFKNVDEVIKAVFSYVKMLQLHGPDERIFSEIQKIHDINFKYSEEIPPVENVESLSENMHFFPSSDYLTGDELYVEYKPDEIKKLLDLMTPERANIIISSKEVKKKYKLDKTEPWFKTNYTTLPIPPSVLECLKNIRPYEEFHLPEVNIFIPTDFSLLPIVDSTITKYPELIQSSEKLELYYKQDTKFLLPLGYINCQIVTPVPFLSAKNAALQDLFISILRQFLVEEFYPARMAQMELGVSSIEKGMIVEVNGFNEKLSLLLEKALEYITDFNNILYEEIFQAMKKVLCRHYINLTLKPGTLAGELRMKLLLNQYWCTVEKYNVMQDITSNDLRQFVEQCFKDIYLQFLIQGNISKEEAVTISDLVVSKLKSQPLKPKEGRVVRVYSLPTGESCCRVNSFNKKDSNCVTVDYYQLGPGKIKDTSLYDLLEMLMEEPIFDTLRTQEQLGYDVSCYTRDTFGILGFTVTVVSQINKHTIDHIESRITSFLENFVTVLKNVPACEFEETVSSLIKLKQCGDVVLKDEVKRNWEEIKSMEYVFDRNEREVECISKFTIDDVITFFAKLIGQSGKEHLKKLTIQVVGFTQEPKDKNEESNSNTEIVKSLDFDIVKGYNREDKPLIIVENINTYTKNLTLYPPNKVV